MTIRIGGTIVSGTLPIASSTVLGGIKVGAGLSIDTENGTLSTTGVTTVNGHSILSDVPAGALFTDTVYTLPTASSTVIGGIKVGTGLDITDGVLTSSAISSLDAYKGLLYDTNNYGIFTNCVNLSNLMPILANSLVSGYGNSGIDIIIETSTDGIIWQTESLSVNTINTLKYTPENISTKFSAAANQQLRITLNSSSYQRILNMNFASSGISFNTKLEVGNDATFSTYSTQTVNTWGSWFVTPISGNYKTLRVTLNTGMTTAVNWCSYCVIVLNPSLSSRDYTKDYQRNTIFPASVSGTKLISTAAYGTPPLEVTSLSKVYNLNSDLLDEQHGAYYLDWANTTNKPTSMTANGGNSTTVNGHTVLSDVPAAAVFTDTVYTLPVATASVSGGIKVGSGLTITSGVLSADATTLINGHTVLTDVPAGAVFTDTVYTLPTASSTVSGGIKVGSGLTITSGVLSANAVTLVNGHTVLTDVPAGAVFTDTTYTLPTASSTVSGGIKVGSGLTIASGVLSANAVTVVNGHTVLSDVPAAAVFTDTVYTHPATHPASIIVQDASNRFVSDTEKTSYLDKYTKTEVDNKFSQVASGLDWKESVATFASLATSYPSPEDGWTVNVKDDDTTYRYSGTTWVAVSANSIPMATTAVAGKMSSDMVIKLNGIATSANNYVHPSTHAATMITGLATVATSGSYADLSNKPTSLLANGGNSTTVNSHTVLTDVPANALFTDTIYTHPATHAATMITGLSTVATSGSYNDLSNKPAIPSAYTLPTASSTVSGGIMVGSGLAIAAGVLSATATGNDTLTEIPIATDVLLGGIMVGSGLSITVDGLLSANAVTTVNGHTVLSNVPAGAVFTDTVYTLPTASATVSGGIKVGSGLTITSGVLSANAVTTVNGHTVLSNVPAGAVFTDTVYTLPVATASVSGGIKVGTGLTITSGVLSANNANNANTTTSQTYTAVAASTGNGISSNITAPTGTYVTALAVRNAMAPTTGNGWTWEAVATGGTSPNIVMEVSAVTGNMRTIGTITGTQVFNPVYADYAEFFPRGGNTEPGDIVSLNIESENEEYVKAISGDVCVVGVHSDEYAHLIGGEAPPADIDYLSYNLPKFIPVGMVGRCRVKFIGESFKGCKVVPSGVAGVGRAFDISTDSIDSIIGFLVESDTERDIRRLKLKLK